MSIFLITPSGNPYDQGSLGSPGLDYRYSIWAQGVRGRKSGGPLVVDWVHSYTTVLTFSGSTIPHPHANPSPHPTTPSMARTRFQVVITFKTLQGMTEQEGVILDTPRNRWLVFSPEF